MHIKIDDPQKYRAALYVRLSKEDIGRESNKTWSDSESIINQEQILREFAREHNVFVYGVYSDDGYSGTNFDRPDFQKMIDDIENGKVNMVITKDLSRLGREYVGVGYYEEIYFPEKEVRFIAINDGYDSESDSPMNMSAPYKNVHNDMFARETSQKVISVKRYKQRVGEFIGGKAPYGYVKSPTQKNKIVIDENTAPIVRMIFELALEGKSCREIAQKLTDDGVPTPAVYAGINLSVHGPYSKKWSSERISFMLQNEVYIGSMVQGRVRKVSYKSKKCRRIPREEWAVVRNTHEPIVDRDTFEKVGLLIKNRNCTRSRTYDYLLKGLIFCHECGYPLGVINRPLAGQSETLYFVCRTYQRFTEYHTCTCHCIKVETITDAVLEEVRRICQQYRNHIDLDELTQNALLLAEKERRKQGKDLSALRGKLDSLQSQMDKSYCDRLSGTIDEEMFQRVYQRFKEEQTDVRNRIKAIESAGTNEPVLNHQKIRELVEAFLNADECSRELLVSLIEKIELTTDKEVLIHYRFKELDLADHL